MLSKNQPMTGFALLLATIAAFVLLLSGTARAGLLAAWEFDPGDVSGSNVSATDGSAANTTGILQDNAAVVSGALDLDGTGDYLQFGNNLADLRGLSDMTLSVWVNPDSLPAGTDAQQVIDHNRNFYLWSKGNAYRYVNKGSSPIAVSTTAPAVGAWVHLLATYSSSSGEGKLYVNGTLEDTGTGWGAMSNDPYTFQIGARRDYATGPGGPAPYRFWDGQLDDVAIWDSILTQSEINSLAGVGVGGYAARTVPTSVLIPEPGSLALLVIGVIGLLCFRRRSGGSY